MSYILDALNKSEKERARKRAPGVTSLQDDKPPVRYTARHYIIALALLAVVNSALVFLFFQQKDENRFDGLKFDEQGFDPELLEVKVKPAAKISEPIPQLPAPLNIVNQTPVRFAELPPAIQAAIPEFEVTAHIYASDQSLRMAKIDGEPRREGDQISADMRLDAITETGLILNYRGHRYIHDVLQDWQAPGN